MKTCVTRDELEAWGFVGFVPVAHLRQSRCDEIPIAQGVYVVLHAPTDSNAVAFLETGTGHWFKGKNPNVAVDTLRANWTTGSQVVYIGKASAGRQAKRGLRKRVHELIRFGNTERVGHWGGRYLWQIDDADGLLICWKITADDPASIESGMITDFVKRHGGRPFANLRN